MLVHVIDFEGNLHCGIIEYGVATLKEGRIVNTQTGLCRADTPLQPRDILLHGLRNEMLEQQPSFTEHQAIFYGLRQSGVLAAHHAPVEHGLLNRYWTVVPSSGDSALPASGGSWGPWIDSRIVAQHYIKTTDYSLGALIQALELKTSLESIASEKCPEDRCKPHCALYDAIASALLLLHLKQHFALDVRGLIRSSQTRTESRGSDFAQEELF